MKKSLPESAKIAKDAKETVQECVSEFICFITSEASDKCQQEKRKTINGEDILWAMSTLGFDKYVEPLKVYLAKYRESVKGEKPEKKQRREDESGAGGFGSAFSTSELAGPGAAGTAAYSNSLTSLPPSSYVHSALSDIVHSPVEFSDQSLPPHLLTHIPRYPSTDLNESDVSRSLQHGDIP